MLGSTTKKRSDSSVDRWEDLSAELWEVQAGPGLTKLMTLDELDAAFKADEISTNTIVRRPGTVQWKTLAEIAGIEPSAVMLESESLIPVASDVELPQIPKAPPLPTDRAKADTKPLTTGELAIVRPRRFRRALAGVAVVAVVGAGVFLGVNGLLSRLNPPQLAQATALVAPPPELPEPAAKVPASTAPVLEQGAVLVLAKDDAGKDAKADAKPAAKAAAKAIPAPKAFAARAAVGTPRVQPAAKPAGKPMTTAKPAEPSHSLKKAGAPRHL